MGLAKRATLPETVTNSWRFGQKEGARRANPATLTSVDGGHAAAVLRVGGIVWMRHRRPLLAVADRLHPPSGDAERAEHVLHRLSTAFAEREVVFAGAALVGVPLDRHGDIGIAPQPLRLALQDL